MTDFSDPFRALVEERFMSEWSIEYPEIPIQIGDAPFEQPDDGVWSAFAIKQNSAQPKTIGRHKWIRTGGFIQIDVMCAKETNFAEAHRQANTAADFFFLKKFKTPLITASFDEKHVSEAPTAPELRRVMARVFFTYEGLEEQTGVQVIT